MLKLEKNLAHQQIAVDSIVSIFKNLTIKRDETLNSRFINPEIIRDEYYIKNIKEVQKSNQIDIEPDGKNIIDIMMETGTGKTYTYTKTIFELNRYFSIFKFIIVVPTLSIKAGTINFLKSKSAIEHFKEQYNKRINLHIVESENKRANKRANLPIAISNFVNSGNYEKNQIQVLIINAGMINSETMKRSFDKTLLDRYSIAFDALASVKPFVIIDEPHKFDTAKKTWSNIERLKAQFILRFGATFPTKEITLKEPFSKKRQKVEVKDYHNLIYRLSAVDAFNKNLVKGVIGHITEFESGKNAILKFVNSDGKEATFELIENGKKQRVKISKKESFIKIHSQMSDLFIEKLNKSKVELSNGLELKKGDKINPYSYSQTVQEIMIKSAIREHFKLERELLRRDIKIKPLTLFFIDNIKEYRDKDGALRVNIEKLIESEVKRLLKSEDNEFYIDYLKKTLENISLTHAGYFSKDNKEKDEVIERELNEILHDKEALLSLKNPRRFIFSKWTLREGWDNPNVFQICKLRSSGSEISKLQEVGRGLRLPVNEYGNRVKDEQFFLNYFVDFTESDFVDRLVNEINEKSNAISIEDNPDILTQDMIKRICDIYKIKEEELLKRLDREEVITRANGFKEGGFEYIKRHFPLIFNGVDSNKVRKSTQNRRKISIRVEKYNDLKELWEKLNERVVLEYKIKDELHFRELLIKFLNSYEGNLFRDGLKQKRAKLKIEDKRAFLSEEFSLDSGFNPVNTMRYSDFLKELAKELSINLKTLHRALIETKLNINNYLNAVSIRRLKEGFNNFLMQNAFSDFEIDYKEVSTKIHPTVLTNRDGKVDTSKLNPSDIGVLYSDEKVAKSYLFNELFYDSELERENIKTDIQEVIVFTKIPKNSIKIPVAGGKSYSPDFAYVLKFKDNKKRLHFIVETKNIEGRDSLREEERQKLKHAEKFFKGAIKIEFREQFSNKKIENLIREIIKESN